MLFLNLLQFLHFQNRIKDLLSGAYDKGVDYDLSAHVNYGDMIKIMPKFVLKNCLIFIFCKLP